ncbi:hypothetical protein, partial [Frankia nepalensis]|uniref:hypothetical protein n=1 Tax=Frankia nepalensis TaxID=1836974 RepID=UPI001EE4323E
ALEVRTLLSGEYDERDAIVQLSAGAGGGGGPPPPRRETGRRETCRRGAGTRRPGRRPGRRPACRS